MSYNNFSEATATLSELRNNPMALVNSTEGMPLAILENSEPVFYCIPVQAWEDLVQIFEYLSRD